VKANPTVVFTGPNRVVIEDRSVPEPGRQEVLIETRASLISTGTELSILTGRADPGSVWDAISRYPFVPGYSNIGTVKSVGPGVDEAWLGQRVATRGKHAHFVVQPASGIRPIQRAELSDAQASFFTIAEVVMNGVRRGNVLWGEAVVVFGLGLLGQLTVRFCRLAGARPVVAVDVAERRLACLPADRPVVGVNPTRADVPEAVRHATRGRMADVVFEVTGNAGLIPSQFAALRTQGRMVILSSPLGKTAFDFHDLCNRESYTIIGAHDFSHPAQATPDNPWTNQRDAELFFDLAADGELDVETLISHRAPFSEAPALYARLVEDRGELLGVVLDWSEA
jgi:2-desacetyl-2-hydroxyethyl bacteriochlorophyllide A dehydrogenase